MWLFLVSLPFSVFFCPNLSFFEMFCCHQNKFLKYTGINSSIYKMWKLKLINKNHQRQLEKLKKRQQIWEQTHTWLRISDGKHISVFHTEILGVLQALRGVGLQGQEETVVLNVLSGRHDSSLDEWVFCTFLLSFVRDFLLLRSQCPFPEHLLI